MSTTFTRRSTTALCGILLAATALSTAFTPAFAAEGIDPAEVTGKITFYTHFTHFVDDGSFDAWGEAFAEKYPGAEVEVIGVTGYRKEMPTRIASGDYGDVLNVLDNLPPSDYATFYEPLNDLGLEDNFQFVDRYTVDGQIYGFIYGLNAEAVVYNKKAFEKAGIEVPPNTKTELFAACEKLKSAGLTPFQINMGAGWPMQQWDKAALLFADRGDYYETMLSSETPYAPDEPYGQSLSFVKELFDAGCTEEDYTANNWDQSKTALGAGEAGMWFLANWSVPQAVAAAEALGVTGADADLGMFPLPIDDGGAPRVLYNPDWAIGVSAKSENKPTAKAWVEFLLTETDVSNKAGFIPGDKRIAATMPQLVELDGYAAVAIEAGTPPSAFKEAMSDARIDFMTGTYIRDAVLAPNFDAALDDLNARWAKAAAN